MWGFGLQAFSTLRYTWDPKCPFHCATKLDQSWNPKLHFLRSDSPILCKSTQKYVPSESVGLTPRKLWTVSPTEVSRTDFSVNRLRKLWHFIAGISNYPCVKLAIAKGLVGPLKQKQLAKWSLSHSLLACPCKDQSHRQHKACTGKVLQMESHSFWSLYNRLTKPEEGSLQGE